MKNSTVDGVPEEGKGQGGPVKRQGPIRVGAIIPFLVISALVWAYFHFFFDGHLRRGLEYAATQGVGAEVNIDAVETNFREASISIRKIQITDASRPTHNLVELGEVRGNLLWDALLRGKVVIEEASVLQVLPGTARAHPGRVLPPAPKGDGLTDKLLASAEQHFSGNVVGDLAAIAQGSDPAEVLKGLEASIKSGVRVEELRKELTQKEQEWRERLAKLPDATYFAALDQRRRKVKLDGFTSLDEVQASVRELDAIYKEVDAKFKEVDQSGRALNGDVNQYKSAFADLEAVVRQDIKDLEAHFHIPDLNAGNIASSMVGPLFMGKVKEASSYLDKAREYMPPPRTAEEKARMRLQAHEREKGRDYVFGRPNSYPIFWLRKAVVTSTVPSGDYAGRFAGTLRDVTSDPPSIGRPLTFELTGDMPNKGIGELLMRLVIDHTTVAPAESFLLQVGRYGVSSQSLVASKEVSITLDKGVGRSTFHLDATPGRVEIGLDNLFSEVDYKVESNTPLVQEIVSGALKDVRNVTLQAKVSGPWDHLDWYMASNLGEALQRGFEREIKAKIDEARRRVEEMVNARIAEERRKLQAQYASIEASLRVAVAEKQAEVERLKGEVEKAKLEIEARKNALIKEQENRLKGQVRQQEQQLQKEGEKALQDWRKKMGL